MSSEQLVQRLISQETGIDTHHLRTGKLTDEEWDPFAHAVEVLGDATIFLDDTPALTPIQLRTKCRRLAHGVPPGSGAGGLPAADEQRVALENRVQEVSYISRNMKILARELNVPVLAAAQLSRAIEHGADKEPQLSDLRKSGVSGARCRRGHVHPPPRAVRPQHHPAAPGADQNLPSTAMGRWA